MRFLMVLLIAGYALAQSPGGDRRNAYVPNTNTHFSAPPDRTLAEWESWSESLREQVRFASGVLPEFEKTALNPQIWGELDRDDYTVFKVLLETMPGYYLGGNLYRPKGEGPFPAVAKPHGHWTYGRLENQPLNSTQTLSVNLAKRGLVVFAYDMVGYNDTQQTPHRFSDKAQMLWNFGPLELQTWNSIRVVDFLESLDYVDRSRMAVTGASGGGTQTFVLAALDDRIAAAAPVNMVSAIMQGGCVCENAPGMRVGTFNVEISALMAPRPQLIVAATGDWTKNVPREEFPAVRKIYELYGQADNVEAVQFDAPHNYNQDSREAVYRFLVKRLLAQNEDPGEKDAQIEQPRDLLALYGRAEPANALDYPGVFRAWQDASRHQLAKATAEEKRHLLEVSLKADWPDSVHHDLAGDRITLTRDESGEQVPGRWTPGEGRALLVVHPSGADAALADAAARQARAAGRPVLAIDAFQTGSAVADRDRSHQHFLTFNLSDDAARVQDVLTAIVFLEEQGAGPVEVTGLEDAAVWTLFAAALAPVDLKLNADLGSFDGSDQSFVEGFLVPGIQRAGGLAAALQLTAGKR
jgi:dienelactone hydrolase